MLANYWNPFCLQQPRAPALQPTWSLRTVLYFLKSNTLIYSFPGEALLHMHLFFIALVLGYTEYDSFRAMFHQNPNFYQELDIIIFFFSTRRKTFITVSLQHTPWKPNSTILEIIFLPLLTLNFLSARNNPMYIKHLILMCKPVLNAHAHDARKVAFTLVYLRNLSLIKTVLRGLWSFVTTSVHHHLSLDLQETPSCGASGFTKHLFLTHCSLGWSSK